jgi:mono/diheme cytochrome c family protein
MTISQGSRFEARRRSPAQTRRRSGSYAARVAALLAVAVPIVAALAASPALLAGCGTDAGPGQTGTAVTRRGDSGGETTASSPVVTPVKGPSWLDHLGLQVSQTRMGEMGGSGPPPAGDRREPDVAGVATASPGPLESIMRRFLSVFRSQPEQPAAFAETFQLAGADLYRLNCRSCHGPGGEGAPPAIKSLLDPVRAASPALLQERMKAAGHPITAAMAEQLASQAEAAIRDRLAHGGKQMPPFGHLRGDEVDALLGYLGQLAGLPPTARTDMLVPQSAARVGEHLVKGTCHICHDATGPGGGHMAMMRGIIPSLASFPRQQSLDSVLRQVEYGSSGMMMMMGGQRMPALPYLTEEEVAAAYFYLAYYPPQP